MKQSICLVFFWFLISLPMLEASGLAEWQNPKQKWGKVSEEEWEMKVCPFDSIAGAVILFDKAKITFRGPEAVIFRHKRIKILDKSAMEYADVNIPFYRHKNLEKVTKLKVQTLKKNDKGKVEKITLENTEEFEQIRDEYWGSVRFAFPAAEVGSILEYKYEFNTGNIFSLEPWYFQNELPTWHSQLNAEIPEALNYKAIKIGQRIQEAYNKEANAEWILREIPGYKNDDFVYQPLDYADQIRFQLNSYWKSVNSGSQSLSGGAHWESVLRDWKDLGNEMLESYKRFSLYRRLVKNYIKQEKLVVDLDQIGLQAVLQHVQKSFQWNQYNSIYLQQSLKDFIALKKGNAAELNLFFYLLLDALGFEAKPVLISSRPNGKLVKNFPLLDQFNRIIMAVKIGEEWFYMDVIPDPIYHPYYLLPSNDFNYFGLQLERDQSQVIKIEKWPSSSKGVTIDVNLSDSIQLLTKYQGYSAMEELSRKRPSYENAEWNLFAGNVQFQFLEGRDRTDVKGGKLELKYAAKIDRDDNDEFFYLSIAEFSDFRENPFQKDQNRISPIELEYPYTENIQLFVKKDESYTLESIPQPLIIGLPDRLGRFNYSVKDLGDKIMLLASIRINKALIAADQYPYLYAFFKQVEEKLAEPLVFERKL